MIGILKELNEIFNLLMLLMVINKLYQLRLT